jgi:phosphohistidine phosphatase
MQQTLYIVRHAHASPADSDRERAVSAKGERQVERLSLGLQGKGLVAPNAIWCSRLARSIQTAELLKEGLDLDAPISEWDGLAPFDSPQSIVDRIQSTESSLMIVGHEPNLSALSSLLLIGNDQFEGIVFMKASILCLTRLSVGQQSTPWQIEWHVYHRLFKS